MRIESSVTSISWIPSAAIEGMTKMPFEVGIAHYDAPPPEILENLDALREKDAFRFANELRAFIEVVDGEIKDFGHLGAGQIGATTMKLGRKAMTFPAVAFPDIRPAPTTSKTSVTFTQTAGGRTGIPAPRRVSRKPFVQIAAPLAWTTLSLTIDAAGSSSFKVTGASPFPRHWIYDSEGKLSAKSGIIDFKTWYKEAFGDQTPWGGLDSPALITKAETALERQISKAIMTGKNVPSKESIKKGQTLVEQGDVGGTLFLLLDGVLGVEVDGESVSEVGPGAILGERALLEGGKRTATLRALTDCRVAVFHASEVDPSALREVSKGHRGENS
ncbi:MAG: cyclic nucleotide-binding domain-containing protein [Actinomycetota bacterium]